MCHCRIPLHYSKIHGTLLYAGKYLPTFYFRPCCQRANFRLGEFQCLKLWNKTIFRQIQNGNCLQEKKAKITRGEKITLYIVLGLITTTMYIYKALFISMVCSSNLWNIYHDKNVLVYEWKLSTYILSLSAKYLAS